MGGWGVEGKEGVRRGEGKEKREGRGEGAITRTGPSMVLQLVLQSKWVILILGDKGLVGVQWSSWLLYRCRHTIAPDNKRLIRVQHSMRSLYVC